MSARLRTTAALGAGALLGAIAVVAAPWMALGAAAFGTTVGAIGMLRVRDIAPGDAASKAQTGRRAGVLVGTGATGGWLALTGLVVLLGPATGALLLLLLVSAAAVWWWWCRGPGVTLRGNPWHAVEGGLLRAAQRPDPPRRSKAPDRAAPPSAAAGPSPPVPWCEPIPANMTIPQLCLTWQRTYFALYDLPAGAPRTEIVRLRERLLDEIERRDPDGFTRWLDTGARPGSDPGRYLAGDR